MPYIKILKSLHVVDVSSIKQGKNYENKVNAIILDTVNLKTGQIGGTGKIHDWSISKQIVKVYKTPVILAGGLNPSNVEEAIKTVRPFGVDVNSGVKAQDGYKDYKKLRSFITKAKRYSTQYKI